MNPFASNGKKNHQGSYKIRAIKPQDRTGAASRIFVEPKQ